MNAGAFDRHHIQVIRDFSPTPLLMADKHKVLQILVNLIRNAKYAMAEGVERDKRMILRVAPGENSTVKISVLDNGVGVAAANLTRIFEHGFTTRKDGHGFALHSGALAARQMGGSLTCQSAGPGQGAAFTLELPLRPPEAAS
jgi:signal transduction histidine kinase